MSTELVEKVKVVREKTGAGLMQCKKALNSSDMNVDEAITLLKLARVGNFTERDKEANQGVVMPYVHHDHSVAAIVEIRCETDFVARNETFQKFAKDIAMHVAASDPSYLTRDEISATVIDHMKKSSMEEVENFDQKPKEIQEKIVNGKMEKKYFKSLVLLDQDFVKDDDFTVGDLVKVMSSRFNEKIYIHKFLRMKLGQKDV